MKIHFNCKYYFPFIFLLFSLLITSCESQPDNEAAKDTAPTENYPEYAAEAAAGDSFSEYAEEAAGESFSLSEYAEETAATTESESESLADFAIADDYVTAAPAPIAYPEQVEETATPAITDSDYAVVLGVDEQMEIPGFPGELRVWIGNPNFKPRFSSPMVQDETTVPAEGESTKVEPFAPAFEIAPAETQCIKIHPRGSEVRFELTPKKEGTFNVGANVFLFDSNDCSGSPIPKTAATLKVTVEVNTKEILVAKARELWNVFWDKLLEFWGALLALIFGLILFLIRKKLKRWFGSED